MKPRIVKHCFGDDVVWVVKDVLDSDNHERPRLFGSLDDAYYFAVELKPQDGGGWACA